jgi:hypothetical protein
LTHGFIIDRHSRPKARCPLQSAVWGKLWNWNQSPRLSTLNFLNSLTNSVPKNNHRRQCTSAC